MTQLKNRQLSFNSPQGYLINGKIVPSVASNNLTVALKTLAGNDPSASDPIYVRIGDTVRTVTSALSNTLNAGFNYFNAGSTELATKEIDYFVYLVWDSNSSAVGLTFARIPYATLVSIFSSDGTNEKGCASYSEYTSTDTVENIGRFAATLSAGAGYTWSVPTFTATNLIQKPIFETRLLGSTSTITAQSGTFTTVSGVTSYVIKQNVCDVSFQITITTNGTAATYTKATLPFSYNSYFPSSGVHSSGVQMISSAGGTAQNINIFKYDGTYLGGNSTSIGVSAKYFI